MEYNIEVLVEKDPVHVTFTVHVCRIGSKVYNSIVRCTLAYTRAVRYHLKYAYHDTTVRVSRYTIDIDTSHDMAYIK